MSFWSDLAKVGGTVAQFIPGGQIAGAGLSALGGVLDASAAAKRKNQVTGQIASNANKLGALGDTYSTLEQTYLPGLVSGAVDSYKNFDPSSFIDPQYRAIIEGAGANADNAVDSTMADFSSRGLLRDSSGLPAAVGGIRANVAATGARSMTDLVMQAQREKQARLMSALGVVQGVGQAGRQATNQALGTMGGLEGMYSSESDALGSALGDLATLAGQTTKRSGKSTLNTNNSASNPVVYAGTNAPLNVPLTYQKDAIPDSPIARRKVSGRPNVSGGY